jgi:hypothetical protein
MIQAIVFLPLIGAILAGLISVFGAHARNPSGDTVQHHDDARGTDAHVDVRCCTTFPETLIRLEPTAMMTPA